MNYQKIKKDDLINLIKVRDAELNTLRIENKRLKGFENKYNICKDARREEKDLREAVAAQNKDFVKKEKEYKDEIKSLKANHEKEIEELTQIANANIKNTQQQLMVTIQKLQKQLTNQNFTMLDLFDMIDQNHKTQQLYFDKYKSVFIDLPKEQKETEE